MLYKKGKNHFLLWFGRNIKPDQQMMLFSVIVGIGGGLAAVILKTFIHYIQDFLTRDFKFWLPNVYYFLYPLIGMILTILFIKYLNRDKLGHGLTNVIYSMRKKQVLLKKIKPIRTW